MSISPISAIPPKNTEPPSAQGKTPPAPESFEHFRQESQDEADLLSADSDQHIDAFFRQTLIHAPEAERKIWARMREELGL